ncbi:MAG: hypothetical protein AAF483_06560 [Planctomycetota bacterium]
MPRLEELLGRRIDAVFARDCSSDYSDRTDYVYRFSDGECFRFPEIYRSIIGFDYCDLSPEHSLFEHQEDRREFFEKNLFQAKICDVIVPKEPELRSPDEFVIRLSSGFYLFQESGNFPGCGSRFDLTESLTDAEMISVFNSPEWLASK